MIAYTEFQSPLGTLLIAASPRGLRGIYFEQHRHFKGKDGWQFEPTHAILQRAVAQLEEFFAGKRHVFDLPLDMEGTPFQQAVWQQLLQIPYGATVSYGQQAHALGKPKAARAVGAAIGRNPVSIVVPCHRVIGSSGSLTDYAGGLERKRTLLQLEARASGLPAS